MELTPTLIQKKDNGRYLSIHFDDNSKFNILSELLRVESPSADVQGHGGPKIIVRNKGNVLIDQSSYEIKGPIDSKVRLEYLFCTGEMFLPNYESNKNE